ncbi:MAG: YfiR family protein, partial [Bacteroidota bacterium]
ILIMFILLELPRPDKSKITIGVMGDSQVIPELQNIAGRGSSSKINIIKIEEKGDVTKCDMIFLPETESKSFDMIQDVIGDKNIVVVAENSKLAKKGAEVGFFLENSKMKFIINKDELEATEVRVSQGLYSIAKII